MDDAALTARYVAGVRAFAPRILGGWNGGRVLPLAGGVQATVCTALPDRSIVNSVTYGDPAAVPPLLGELAARYEAAGIRAWTVWVRPPDRELAAALADAGHVRDAAPEMMAAPLTEIGSPDEDDEVRADATWDEVAAVNDAAYGIPPGYGFTRLFGGAPEEQPGLHRAVVRSAGRAVCCAVAHEQDGDAYVAFVATDPAHRRRGLASRVMRRMLADAGARGCTTTTLEASALGRGVYEAMGYRSLGPAEMWEYRPAAS